MSDATAIDDMQGLFSHVSDAYRAGEREGRDLFYKHLISALGHIGVAHEKAGNVAAFHAVEECTAAMVSAKQAADAPKTV